MLEKRTAAIPASSDVSIAFLMDEECAHLHGLINGVLKSRFGCRARHLPDLLLRHIAASANSGRQSVGFAQPHNRRPVAPRSLPGYIVPTRCVMGLFCFVLVQIMVAAP